MELGKKFNDLGSYNNSMARAVDEKLFFLDKLKVQRFVLLDFGCADGSILRAVEKLEPEGLLCQNYRKYLGYDPSRTMIDLAKKSWDGNSRSVYFTDDWDRAVDVCQAMALPPAGGKVPVILLLSSVLHEVYSYGTPETIGEFWDRLSDLKPDIIVFRDMMWNSHLQLDSTEVFVDRIRRYSVKPGLESFEERWGKIDEPKNLVHYLLKYRWQVNWERENNENYFPVDFSDFLTKVRDIGYEPSYLEHAPVPYIQNKIQEDWGFRLEIPTHLKAVFRKKV